MKNIKAGDIILVPENDSGDASDIYNTKWVINKKPANKSQSGTIIGKVWFCSEPELGVVEIDFKLANDRVKTEYIRDALMVMTQWAFSGKKIFEVSISSPTWDHNRIEIIERSGFVYRQGNREEEKYSVMKPQTTWITLYMLIGLVVGLTLGIILGSMTIGLIIGLVAGFAVGSGLDAKAKEDRLRATGEKKPKRRVPVTDISLLDKENLEKGIKPVNYRNVFEEIGIPAGEVEERLKSIVEQFFKGEDSFYHEVGADMGYFEDTGNNDARTEGMSYGMMMCVQLDMKEEFDRIWKWSKTYMFMKEGFNEGYFAWSCATDGTPNADGPAPDGEEFYAMALFFASHRWGDGEGIFNYSHEAKELLKACIHKGENGRVGTPMWNKDNHQILFVPGIDYTDPSYHLPHFYSLFAKWAYEEDSQFWKTAEKVSREYLAKACHPVTGFSAEYAEFDGTPMSRPIPWTTDRHDWFYSDAYRTAANIGLDYLWNGIDVGQAKAAGNIQRALLEDMRNDTYRIYELDGAIAGEAALHPYGITATVAQSVLASELDDVAIEWVKKFYDMPLRTGVRRYYDNCLYMFAFLALSGNYRIW